MGENVPDEPPAGRLSDKPHDPSPAKSSNRLVAALVVAVAVAAFTTGYAAATLTAQDGLSDEQMQLLLSNINAPSAASAGGGAPGAPVLVRASLVDNDPLKGNPDAELTIVEFSDFECPFCKRFYDQTLPLIDDNYIKTGKVNLVYRDFPLPNHMNAMPTHLASECANEQGAFWAYHDILFETQRTWAPMPSESIFEHLVQYADYLGLDTDEFGSCLSSSKFGSEIEGDYQDGVANGVRGTPAFFIGNEGDGYVLLSGAQPFEAFKNVIDSKLG